MRGTGRREKQKEKNSAAMAALIVGRVGGSKRAGGGRRESARKVHAKVSIEVLDSGTFDGEEGGDSKEQALFGKKNGGPILWDNLSKQKKA